MSLADPANGDSPPFGPSSEPASGLQDPGRSSPARLCNCLLGGKDNYAADRALAEQLIAIHPYVTTAAYANRAFLGRAVRTLIEYGIRQFVDIGCGLPTTVNLHKVASRHAPDARVLYVDRDPLVLAHARALLVEGGNVAVAQADLRKPEQVLDAAEALRLIDFAEPVAVVLTAVLHLISDAEDPYGIVAMLRSVLPPGSALVLSHLSADVSPNEVAAMASVYSSHCTSPLIPRPRTEIARFFGDFQLLEPGLVYTSQWRTDTPSARGEQALNLAAVVVRNLTTS